MFLVQKWPFFHLFLKQYRPGKCVLRYSRKNKITFWAINTKSLKIRKNLDFSKGLTNGYCPKMAIFPPLLMQYRQEKCMKNRIFRLKKPEVQKVKEWTFFQRS